MIWWPPCAGKWEFERVKKVPRRSACYGWQPKKWHHNYNDNSDNDIDVEQHPPVAVVEGSLSSCVVLDVITRTYSVNDVSCCQLVPICHYHFTRLTVCGVHFLFEWTDILPPSHRLPLRCWVNMIYWNSTYQNLFTLILQDDTQIQRGKAHSKRLIWDYTNMPVPTHI